MVRTTDVREASSDLSITKDIRAILCSTLPAGPVRIGLAPNDRRRGRRIHPPPDNQRRIQQMLRLWRLLCRLMRLMNPAQMYRGRYHQALRQKQMRLMKIHTKLERKRKKRVTKQFYHGKLHIEDVDAG
mmetsp:Transcript_6101/g.9161  ORF Transcript_6101/g.9161 Transcript_6101/m.9161 type:complete len:129 (-) Transcript_6101:204-590(-)